MRHRVRELMGRIRAGEMAKSRASAEPGGSLLVPVCYGSASAEPLGAVLVGPDDNADDVARTVEAELVGPSATPSGGFRLAVDGVAVPDPASLVSIYLRTDRSQNSRTIVIY